MPKLIALRRERIATLRRMRRNTPLEPTAESAAAQRKPLGTQFTMLISMKIVVGALLVIVIGIVLTFGHGPVGPESVVRKDVADYVERAALHADAIVVQPRPRNQVCSPCRPDWN